ncbi:MAG: UDP-N-acetylenolpyruvoylglucosamine reductase [Armatimonadetes bacterium JP3_11]|jgi:UDP-N-acetylmuramate dehydrogenase|nr:MAG: UDP-N-acetylenolpyruvoylglucosamine reductase [Armatimonadetes bacterium CP1_7O]OYT75220.1 MAG: UDP-N-acetylenolpyruvoylglucosamine reductase [Armatimonadetes bacterium JP3_11]RMH07409.1 MAG: UDP-N-acetylmuramate dehydrogenase [Armatimonadota bacterium]
MNWEALLEPLSRLCIGVPRRAEPLRRHTTLRVGGPAALFYKTRDLEEFARISLWAHQNAVPVFVMGHGSNILVSDRGLPALVLYNACERMEIGEETYAETGVSFRELFLKTAQAGLSGLEFAVGIPGTLGGALVSNAGAYRSNIADLLIEIDLVSEGVRKRTPPRWMQFSYRDSLLRRPNAPPTSLLAVRLRLKPDRRRDILMRAREFQRQRILKQPPESSAGSFFKNVYNRALAEQLPNLPTPIREAGVVPAGYLIEACGLKGYAVGGACVSRKHANFLINRGWATASDFDRLARHIERVVYETYGVQLEREVLRVGDWEEEADLP